MIYVTSDLHGCPLDALDTLLAKADFGPEDFLFILGDVIDWGDEGVKLLCRLMTSANIQLIRGNHEQMLLDSAFLFEEISDSSLNMVKEHNMDALSTWLLNGAEPTLRDLKTLAKTDPDTLWDLLDFLEDTPLWETVSTEKGDFLLTHAGLGNFHPSKKLSQYTAEELLWNRPQKTDRYFEAVTTIFGHTPTIAYGTEFAGRILKTDTWLNIDTGAGHGGTPTLLCLDTMESFSL